MIEWITSLPWLEIISIAVAIFVAVTSYLYARKALVRASEADEIAGKALSKAGMQFTTLNRPLLIIKPVSLKKENNYFNIDFLDRKKLIIKIPISIKNLGNLVADNTFLHSTNCMLYINNCFPSTQFGQMDLSEISPLHVQSFIAKKIKAGIGKNSINRYLQIIRSMLNIAKEYGYAIGENPVKQKVLFNEAEFRRTRILNHEEEKRLIKEAAPHLKTIIQFALKTGCRLQEILGLQKDDLDLKNGTIVIRPEINKTGKRDIIPMSSDVRNLLEILITNNNGSKYVFSYFNCSKNDFVPVKSIYIAFSNACKRAKISGLQFRDLRRTFSSRLHELQTDPLLIQRLLRHSSFRMSEEVYIQSSMKLMKDAVENLC